MLVFDLLIEKETIRTTMEEYKKEVTNALEFYQSLGVTQTNTILSILGNLEQQEALIYGKNLSQESILEEISQINQEIQGLERERSDLDMQMFLDFLMQEVDKNPACLIAYTEEMDAELDNLLEGVVID
jgi:hypothetical protein